jgi:hypothetical protein
MSRVMFTISYGVKPEMREKYLGLVGRLKAVLKAKPATEYSVFEAKGKRNVFTEVFIMKGLEEFESFEDDQDNATRELLEKLEECVEKGGRRYSTLVEVEVD